MYKLWLSFILVERNCFMHVILCPAGNPCSPDRGGWWLLFQIQKEPRLRESSHLLSLRRMPHEGNGTESTTDTSNVHLKTTSFAQIPYKWTNFINVKYTDKEWRAKTMICLHQDTAIKFSSLPLFRIVPSLKPTTLSWCWRTQAQCSFTRSPRHKPECWWTSGGRCPATWQSTWLRRSTRSFQVRLLSLTWDFIFDVTISNGKLII